MVYTRTKIALLASSFLLPLFVSAVPQNYTIDDSDQVAINYWEDQQWSHDPLEGYQQFFVNGTRSYTYVPGAAALFNFTGTGIYLQGPYSSDMALRSVTLDDQDMGTFAAYSPERLPTVGTSAVFWGQGGLTNTLHTVAVAHADTADKILVMDAWIYEADSSQSPQGTGTITTGITAGAVVSSPSSTSGPNSNSTSSSSTSSDTTSTMMSKTPLIIGITIPLLLLLFCIAGFCLFRRRSQRNAQRQHDAIKEKMFPSSGAAKNPMRLSQPVYPVSAAPGYSSSESNAELASAGAGAAVPRGGGGGGRPDGVLSSHPFHNRPRAASDTYNNNNEEDSLGLSNHPLFIPTPITSRASDSSDSHYPTPPPYAGAPMLFFEQRPDPIPPLNSDYAPQPIINASPPTSPSVFRRLSTSIAGVIPGLVAAAATTKTPVRSLSRNSNGGGGKGEGGRRTSVLTDFRYNTTTTSPRANNNLGLYVERTASPRSRDRDAYLPYPPPHYLPSSPIPRSPNYQFSSSPNSNSIPLSPISAISTAGFARQSANLGDLKLGDDLKYETSNLSTADTLHTLNTSDDNVKTGELTVDGGGRELTGTGVERQRGSKADPFDDEYAFSSYTRLTRDEVMRSRPVSGISANNPQ